MGWFVIGRKERIWYPGAVYHIMIRGIRRADIFKDEGDYGVYLENVEMVMRKYPFILYSYCLMTNHVHLQLETIDDEIWNIMREINRNYTKYFNKKYNYTGSLYDGRYKSEIIENDQYNLQVSRYIHLNPVKANMVNEPLEYKWSSYNAYIDADADNDRIIDDEKILSYFKDKSRALYMKYVESIDINLEVDKEIKERMEDE